MKPIWRRVKEMIAYKRRISLEQTPFVSDFRSLVRRGKHVIQTASRNTFNLSKPSNLQMELWSIGLWTLHKKFQFLWRSLIYQWITPPRLQKDGKHNSCELKWDNYEGAAYKLRKSEIRKWNRDRGGGMSECLRQREVQVDVNNQKET